MSMAPKVVCPGFVKTRYSGWSVMTPYTRTTSLVVLLASCETDVIYGAEVGSPGGISPPGSHRIPA